MTKRSFHVWSTYHCSDHSQRDECLDCNAERVRGGNSNWKWRYVKGDDTCAVPQDLSAAEKRLAVRGRE